MTDRFELLSREDLLAECRRLDRLVNSPEVKDFIKGVQLEAAHQVERWPANHDDGKSPWDWFWTLGYLSQKAAAAAVAQDVKKAKHHCISSAALLANWHRQLTAGEP